MIEFTGSIEMASDVERHYGWSIVAKVLPPAPSRSLDVGAEAPNWCLL
jgi:hypothetical protein